MPAQHSSPARSSWPYARWAGHGTSSSSLGDGLVVVLVCVSVCVSDDACRTRRPSRRGDALLDLTDDDDDDDRLCRRTRPDTTARPGRALDLPV